MIEDSPTDNAIVPEDKNKQLALPSEMIQRGLELAIQIEQKHGITPIPIKSECKEYSVLCYSAIMEWLKKDDGSYTLTEADKAMTNLPIYLALSIDSTGIHISCATKNLNSAGIEGNEDRYRLLNTFNSLSSFTIPFTSFGLFYTLTHGMDETLSTPGGLFSRLGREAMKNLSFRMAPAKEKGYRGRATKDANPFFNIDRDCVETVIIYVAVLDDTNVDQGLIANDSPLKLSLVVIDQNGKDGLIASRELYHAILEAQELNANQKIYVHVDELYRNIPANISQEKKWAQWEYIFRGKSFKEKGRIEGVSLHPNDGKLFFIINLHTDNDGAVTKTKQIALSVEDAHTVALGEKEGSFLLDNTKWICLGKTYAFTGTVFLHGRFDKELSSTDFRDLVIIKAKLSDIVEQ